MKTVIVPFFIAHQGCPHRCVFCDQQKIAGGAEKVPSQREISTKIAAFRGTSSGRPPEVAFFGGTFTALPALMQEQLLRPLQPMLEKGEISSVRVSTRPDAVDADTAQFLKSMRVGTVELGIQSMDDAVLAKSGRGHTARDTESACKLLTEAGFRVGAQLMPGLPGDSAETALATLQKVLSLNPAFLRIYPTLVIAGTELEKRYRKGEYTPLGTEEAMSLCKVMLHAALTASVPVVRIGLQATEELTDSAVIAGPWHPAFRQLVEGELFHDLALSLAGDFNGESRLTLHCAPSRVSDVTGQRRLNIHRLGMRLGQQITVLPDPSLSPLELRVEGGYRQRVGSVISGLNYDGVINVC